MRMHPKRGYIKPQRPNYASNFFSFIFVYFKREQERLKMKLSKRIDLVNIGLSEIEEELGKNLFPSERKTITETRTILLRLYNQTIKQSK